jgi:hypothetical protein
MKPITRRLGITFKRFCCVLLVIASGAGLCMASGTDIHILMEIIGEGNTDPPEGANLFYLGDFVVLYALPEDGWHFNRWIIEDSDFAINNPGSSSAIIHLSVQRDFKITAVFTCNEDFNPIAEIQLPYSDPSISEGESVNFQGTASGGNPPYTYLWHFGGGLPDSTEEDPGSQIFNKSGVYTVTMTVFDDDGDSDSDTVTVTVTGDEGDGSGGGGGCFVDTVRPTYF